jgi:acyl-CoA thioesterase FadM
VILYFRFIFHSILAFLKSRHKVGDTHVERFIVWPWDLDINGHLNSARYSSFAEIAANCANVRNGFFSVAAKNKIAAIKKQEFIFFKKSLYLFETLFAEAHVASMNKENSLWEITIKNASQEICAKLYMDIVLKKDRRTLDPHQLAQAHAIEIRLPTQKLPDFVSVMFDGKHSAS